MRSRTPIPFSLLFAGAGLFVLAFACTGTTDPEAISCLDENDCPPDCVCIGASVDIGACVNDAVDLECAGSCTVEDPCPEGSACVPTGQTDRGSIIYGCVDNCADITCEPDDNECTTEACDPADGICKSTPIDNGAECDDGRGACMDGTCVLITLDGCGELAEAYRDGDFDDDDWTSAEVPELSAGDTSIERIETMPTGGNPGAHRQVDIRLNVTGEDAAVIWVAHALDEASYDPSVSGAICGVRFYLDGTDQFAPLVTHNAIFSVFLEQGGTSYWAARRFVVTSDEWETDSWVTTTDTFVRVGDSGPEQPDFSASGAPIQFGYMTGNSRPATAPGEGGTTSGADNFRVEVFVP